MTSDKRRFSRIFFNVKAKLTVDEVVYAVDRIANLSVGGCLLEIEGEFALGSDCKFTIPLPGIDPGVDVFGEIVRVGQWRGGPEIYNLSIRKISFIFRISFDIMLRTLMR